MKLSWVLANLHDRLVTGMPSQQSPIRSKSEASLITKDCCVEVVALVQYSPSQACIFVGIIEEQFSLRAAVSVVQFFRQVVAYSTSRDNLSVGLLCGQVCSNPVGAGIFVLCNERFDEVFADMC